MSKGAEQKALEEYPVLFSERNGYDNTFKDRRESYIKGYDQAAQDFLEKACEWLSKHPMSSPVFWTVEEFKNDMEEDI